MTFLPAERAFWPYAALSLFATGLLLLCHSSSFFSSYPSYPALFFSSLFAGDLAVAYFEFVCLAVAAGISDWTSFLTGFVGSHAFQQIISYLFVFPCFIVLSPSYPAFASAVQRLRGFIAHGRTMSGEGHGGRARSGGQQEYGV